LHLLGFHYKNISRCTVLLMSNVNSRIILFYIYLFSPFFFNEYSLSYTQHSAFRNHSILFSSGHQDSHWKKYYYPNYVSKCIPCRRKSCEIRLTSQLHGQFGEAEQNQLTRSPRTTSDCNRPSSASG